MVDGNLSYLFSLCGFFLLSVRWCVINECATHHLEQINILIILQTFKRWLESIFIFYNYGWRMWMAMLRKMTTNNNNNYYLLSTCSHYASKRKLIQFPNISVKQLSESAAALPQHSCFHKQPIYQHSNAFKIPHKVNGRDSWMRLRPCGINENNQRNKTKNIYANRKENKKTKQKQKRNVHKWNSLNARESEIALVKLFGQCKRFYSMLNSVLGCVTSSNQ